MCCDRHLGFERLQVRNGSVGWDSATDWENKWPRESIRELY